MAQTRAKPKPPPAPKLPTKDDLMSAAERKAQAAPHDQSEEQDEGSVVDQIRAHLSEVDDLLDQLEGEGG